MTQAGNTGRRLGEEEEAVPLFSSDEPRPCIFLLQCDTSVVGGTHLHEQEIKQYNEGLGPENFIMHGISRNTKNIFLTITPSNTIALYATKVPSTKTIHIYMA